MLTAGEFVSSPCISQILSDVWQYRFQQSDQSALRLLHHRQHLSRGSTLRSRHLLRGSPRTRSPGSSSPCAAPRSPRPPSTCPPRQLPWHEMLGSRREFHSLDRSARRTHLRAHPVPGVSPPVNAISRYCFVYACVMSGKRGPNRSSFGPISGFAPCKLM